MFDVPAVRDDPVDPACIVASTVLVELLTQSSDVVALLVSLHHNTAGGVSLPSQLLLWIINPLRFISNLFSACHEFATTNVPVVVNVIPLVLAQDNWIFPVVINCPVMILGSIITGVANEATTDIAQVYQSATAYAW